MPWYGSFLRIHNPKFETPQPNIFFNTTVIFSQCAWEIHKNIRQICTTPTPAFSSCASASIPSKTGFTTKFLLFYLHINNNNDNTVRSIVAWSKWNSTSTDNELKQRRQATSLNEQKNNCTWNMNILWTFFFLFTLFFFWYHLFVAAFEWWNIKNFFLIWNNTLWNGNYLDFPYSCVFDGWVAVWNGWHQSKKNWV